MLTVSLENSVNYSIFVLYVTMVGDEAVTEEYLDPMKKEATQVLIDEVYQKHYDHYYHEFGKTIVGFFLMNPVLVILKDLTLQLVVIICLCHGMKMF